MKIFLVRGVPASVQTDGWWINKDTSGTSARRDKRVGGLGVSSQEYDSGSRALALIALLALADLLIWQVAAGVSLAVCGLAVLGAGFVFAGRRGGGGVAVATVFFLPVVEEVQGLSLLFWWVGMALGAGWIGLARWPGAGRWVTAGLRFVTYAPMQVAGDVRGEIVAVAGKNTGRSKELRAILASWALPVGLGAVFVMLLLAANPMVEGWINAVVNMRWIAPFSVDRAVFWGMIAALVWPFLVLSRMRERLKLPYARRPEVKGPQRRGLVNAGSVRRSLILFNVLFALQTGMDGAYLWGGAALPEGMGYAEYAHRGAYPLLVMALLAGVFALVSQRFVVGNGMLKTVLLIWIGQTVLLVISSLYRLDLYIDAYGLTRMRMAAALWMGVVAVGLVMVIWQVQRGHNVRWLLLRVALLGAGVLYGACFHSFDRTIARYNLSHEVKPDVYYICGLGAAALPEIRAYEHRTGQRFCQSDEPRVREFTDWREWGFRDWRVRRTLGKITLENGQL